MQNERYEIITPEQVKITYSIAGIGTRSLAVGIDMLIQGAAMFFIVLGFYYMAGTGALSESLYLAGIILAAALLFFVYFIVFEIAMDGKTPGKAAVGIRVLYTNGQPVSFYGALMRNLFRLLDFLPAFYGIGVIALFVSKDARRIGDIVAGTIVVIDRTKARKTFKTIDALLEARNRDRTELKRKTSVTAATVSTEQENPPPIAVNKATAYALSSSELALVGDFLRRSERLKYDAKQKLAESVARPFYDKFRVPDEHRHHHIEFLQMLYRENSDG